MFMNAIVVGSDVQESIFYDQVTAQPKPSYVVHMTVIDADTKEKYECQVDGFPRLDELKAQKQQGASSDILAQIADQLRAELPPDFTRLQLEVLKFKGKSAAFIKLVCRLMPVVQ
jgi:hypothetical protein